MRHLSKDEIAHLSKRKRKNFLRNSIPIRIRQQVIRNRLFRKNAKRKIKRVVTRLRKKYKLFDKRRQPSSAGPFREVPSLRHPSSTRPIHEVASSASSATSDIHRPSSASSCRREPSTVRPDENHKRQQTYQPRQNLVKKGEGSQLMKCGDWTKQYSRTYKQYYFHNSRTNESQWMKPKKVLKVEKIKKAINEAWEADDSLTVCLPRITSQAADNLPQQCVLSEGLQTELGNKALGPKNTVPENLSQQSVVSEGIQALDPKNTGEGSQVLTCGDWAQYCSRTKKKNYYYNSKTNESRWLKPSEMIEMETRSTTKNTAADNLSQNSVMPQDMQAELRKKKELD